MDDTAPATQYMIVEHFRDPVAIYRRLRDEGRHMPAGLRYLSSFIDEKFERCYQLMETHDRKLLEEWMAAWADLMDFEVYPVITSQQAIEKIAPRL
jgi:Domain of unknown function (DUF3303)